MRLRGAWGVSGVMTWRYIVDCLRVCGCGRDCWLPLPLQPELVLTYS